MLKDFRFTIKVIYSYNKMQKVIFVDNFLKKALNKFQLKTADTKEKKQTNKFEIVQTCWKVKILFTSKYRRGTCQEQNKDKL